MKMQDLLGLDTNSRINIPGKVGDMNWSWQLNSFIGVNKNIKKFSKM